MSTPHFHFSLTMLITNYKVEPTGQSLWGFQCEVELTFKFYVLKLGPLGLTMMFCSTRALSMFPFSQIAFASMKK